MLAAGTAYGDDKMSLPFVDVAGNQKTQEVFELSDELMGHGPAQDVVLDLLILSRKIPQGLLVMGIGQKADIKDQICIHGQAVLKAEGDHGNVQQLAQGPLPGKEGKELLPELRRRNPGSVQDDIGPAP